MQHVGLAGVFLPRGSALSVPRGRYATARVVDPRGWGRATRLTASGDFRGNYFSGYPFDGFEGERPFLLGRRRRSCRFVEMKKHTAEDGDQVAVVEFPPNGDAQPEDDEGGQIRHDEVGRGRHLPYRTQTVRGG